MTERELQLEGQVAAVLQLAERQQAQIEALTSAIRRHAQSYRALQSGIAAHFQARSVEERAADVLVGVALDLLNEQSERT